MRGDEGLERGEERGGTRGSCVRMLGWKGCARGRVIGRGSGNRQNDCHRAFGRKEKVIVGRCTDEGRQGRMAGEESARQQST